MSVANFIQTIWSKKIQDDLELKCKLVDNCLRSYEGDVDYARTVKILGVGTKRSKASIVSSMGVFASSVWA